MKTHKVIDTTMTIEEGQDCFDGTHQECIDFVATQPDGNVGYEIVPMTKAEIESHPDNKFPKVVDKIDLSKIVKSKKPRFVVGVDKSTGVDKSVTKTIVVKKETKIEKPRFVVKKKEQDLPKEEIKEIYTKQQTEFGDPISAEVNYAFHIIKNIEKTEKGLSFLNHVARTWNPQKMHMGDFMLKVPHDGMKCCILNKPIAGISPLAEKLVEVTPISYTAKRVSGTLTQQDIDERNARFEKMPEEYRIQRIGLFSFNSDKVISIAGYVALKYYLLEDTTRLLKFEVKPQTIEDLFEQKKETPEEYAERHRLAKQMKPDPNFFGLEGENLSKLQKLKAGIEAGYKK